MTLAVNDDRLRESFETYSAIGAIEDGGLHRLALSQADRQARDQLVTDMEDLGLEVRVDELGNIFGRREGTDRDADPVLIGSHLDTQPYGGRYDGQLGVLVALETLRVIADRDCDHRRPIELVNWTNEEGSRFQPGLLGSKAFVGQKAVAEARATEDADGVTVAEALAETGYDGDKPCEAFDIHAFLELHVEQGKELDASGDSVGVVDGAYGLAWFEATVEGRADHSGPTKMHDRYDALAAATDAIDEIGHLPQRLAPDAVATVGSLSVEPGSINVIPHTAEFTVDIRSFDEQVIAAAPDRVEAELAAACRREDTSYDLTQLDEQSPLSFAPSVVDAVEGAAEMANVAYRHVVSGAGHDAKALHAVTDSGMLFVPSVDGLTHNEAEFTEWDDVVAGATIFANAAFDLAIA